MKTKVVSPREIAELIKSNGVLIGYVEFVKRDGTLRKMWFQSHIPVEYLAGGDRVYDPEQYRLTWVRDILLPGCAVRSIRWDAVRFLSVRNKKYKLRSKV